MGNFEVETGTGSTTSNSFITTTAATTLLEQHVFREEWKCMSVIEQEVMLRFATSWLAEKFRFFGQVSQAPQALPFPRTSLIDQFGEVIPTDTMPAQLLLATTLVALEMAKFAGGLKEGATELSTSVAAEGEVRSVTIDTLAVDFSTGEIAEATRRQFVGKRLPEIELLLASIATLKEEKHLDEALVR